MDHRLKLMPLWLSFILFGVPGVVIYWGMYYGAPLLFKEWYSTCYLLCSFIDTRSFIADRLFSSLPIGWLWLELGSIQR